MEYEKELEKIKENVEKAKSVKIKAEARLEQLKIQENQILDEMKKIGVNPDNIDEIIKQLEFEIENGINEIKETMPDLSDLQ